MRPAYRTWSEFLEEGFPKITGLQTRTAYGAMELAGSRTLKEISAEDRAGIPLSNAKTLVQLEKANPQRRLPVETVQKAKTLPSVLQLSNIGLYLLFTVSYWP